MIQLLKPCIIRHLTEMFFFVNLLVNFRAIHSINAEASILLVYAY